MTSIRFGDVRKGDSIAINGVRVQVDRVEPNPADGEGVILTYRGEGGTQHQVTRRRNQESTLYDRPTIDEEDVIGTSSERIPDFPWIDVRVGHTVLVSGHGNVVITKIEEPTVSGTKGKVYSFVDSDGNTRSVLRARDHTTDRTIVPGEVIEDFDEEDVIGASSDPKIKLVQWKDVRKGDRVEVAYRGECEVLHVTRPSKGQVVTTVLDSDGKAHVEERSSVLTTQVYDRPTEDSTEEVEDLEDLDEDGGEKAELEESPDVIVAGSLTARFLERPITFRYDSTQGFDTTIHAARLVGYSVNLKDVNLYLDNGEIHVPIKVTYDQVLTIHPKTPE